MFNKPQTTGERLEYKRKELKLSYSTISELFGTTASTIQRYCKGTTKKIPTDFLYKFAEVYAIDINWLLGSNENEIKTLIETHNDILPLNLKKFPLLGEISCGQPVLVEEMTEYFIACDLINADFCLKAKGDSMVNAKISEGDIVFIRTQNMVDNGEIAAILIENETTLKRLYYYPDENRILLQSENNKYPPMIYKNEQLDQITILGKAVKVMSNL